MAMPYLPGFLALPAVKLVHRLIESAIHNQAVKAVTSTSTPFGKLHRTQNSSSSNQETAAVASPAGRSSESFDS